jgi:hypothetical protein
MNGSRDSLICFHSSASASQYSIFFLESAAAHGKRAPTLQIVSLNTLSFPNRSQSDLLVINAN